MLSILIPVFNFSLVEFVADLRDQALQTGIPFEIRCYDDGSEVSFKERNRIIQDWSYIVYHELEENSGRSAIRNALANDAVYPYLLFNDCDARTIGTAYIQRYVSFIQNTPHKTFVVYGGHTYPEHPPAKFNGLLHWTYGIQKDVKSATERAKKPYLNFKTINFLIPRDLFLKNQLDEELKGYGHEDTLIALNFRKQQIPLYHIDNPVCHLGIVDNQTFLAKTAESVSNVATLINKGYIKQEIKLSKFYFLLKNLGLSWLALKIFKHYQSKLKDTLLNDRPSLRLLDIYKLGLLLANMRQLSEDTNS